ncbi:hypothetical protein AVEN_52143-1 [Araneus ventricosus]|uniref:Uncharacterized protein n=1 Tax=Araneus ventricosus TaxID=182803 RepID=A0A4Y2Q2M8_ARAVE|nr:hypothetical protein AVEN_52143-1 [Araneus ventricosus]
MISLLEPPASLSPTLTQGDSVTPEDSPERDYSCADHCTSVNSVILHHVNFPMVDARGTNLSSPNSQSLFIPRALNCTGHRPTSFSKCSFPDPKCFARLQSIFHLDLRLGPLGAAPLPSLTLSHSSTRGFRQLRAPLPCASKPRLCIDLSMSLQPSLHCMLPLALDDISEKLNLLMRFLSRNYSKKCLLPSSEELRIMFIAH